jgi:hypothetical protein
VITAGVTAAVAAILSLFGIKPGPYLVVVAVVVKAIVVLLGVVFGMKLARRRRAAAAASAPSAEPAKAPVDPSTP